jgi:hypothetical protein
MRRQVQQWKVRLYDRRSGRVDGTTQFAHFIRKYLSPHMRLLDLGSGAGNAAPVNFRHEVAEVEEARNHVCRLAPRKVAACLRHQGFPHTPWRRTLMYYPYKSFAWFRWFDWAPLFRLFRAGFWGVNAVLGRWGNKLTLAGLRGTYPEAHHGSYATFDLGFREVRADAPARAGD